MSIEREKFLETLAGSFEAYYDIHRPAEDPGLPLVFRADYHSRAERYWLSKNIPIWGNETNEFAYVFSAPAFDTELARQCIDFALDEALPMVKPHREHQYTNVKVILLADRYSAPERRKRRVEEKTDDKQGRPLFACRRFCLTV